MEDPTGAGICAWQKRPDFVSSMFALKFHYTINLVLLHNFALFCTKHCASKKSLKMISVNAVHSMLVQLTLGAGDTYPIMFTWEWYQAPKPDPGTQLVRIPILVITQSYSSSLKSHRSYFQLTLFFILNPFLEKSLND